MYTGAPALRPAAELVEPMGVETAVGTDPEGEAMDSLAHASCNGE